MTPAEKLAAIKALIAALSDEAKVMEAEVLHIRELTGAKSFDTAIGTVTWTKRKPTIGFDDDGLLQFAHDNAEWEIETIIRVRESFRKQFAAVGDAVVYTPTGEEVDFATIRAGSEFPTVRLTDEAKQQAQEAVHGRLDVITGLLEVAQ